jgi:hypothetical protein
VGHAGLDATDAIVSLRRSPVTQSEGGTTALVVPLNARPWKPLSDFGWVILTGL